MNYAIKDFEFVNERAHFDYQQDKVFIRTNAPLKRKKAQQEAKKRKKRARANRCAEIIGQECLLCGGSELIRIPDGRLARLAFDLRITRNGVRRWVTRYTTTWHSCTTCGKKFLPRDYLRLDEHCHSLKSWGMYEHVAHYSSFASIAEKLHDFFDLPVFASDVYAWKGELAQYYEATYRRIVEKLVAGHLIHADETEVHLKGGRKGYVWVFTSLDEVIYMYRESREGSFLLELLKGFRGVLVSDFYTAYDSIACEQQKCLVHLMRDFNHDLLGNPWDEELKAIGAYFGALMRTVSFR